MPSLILGYLTVVAFTRKYKPHFPRMQTKLVEQNESMTVNRGIPTLRCVAINIARLSALRQITARESSQLEHSLNELHGSQNGREVNVELCVV